MSVEQRCCSTALCFLGLGTERQTGKKKKKPPIEKTIGEEKKIVKIRLIDNKGKE